MDPLDRLIELAQSASSRMDRFRIERTIMLVMRAWETVLWARRTEEQAWQRVTQAKAASQPRREDGTGRLVELQIIQDRYQK
jgi:hypothetical protein